MVKQNFKLEGLKELDAALAELPKKATARAVIVRAFKKAGQPVADHESSLAPYLYGGLSRSPGVTQTLSRSQKKELEKESHVEVYIGPTAAPKSGQTEFGNAHQAPHPHLRPAWDAGGQGVLDSVVETLRTEVEKTMANIAKRAAREAAKMGAK